MAIQSRDVNKQPGHQADTGATQQSTDFGYSAQQRQRVSWTNIGSGIAGRAPRGPSGAALSAFSEAITPILEKSNQGYTYSTIKLDVNDYPDLFVSCLVLVGHVTDQPQLGFGYHVLLIEGSIDPLAPAQANEAGQNFQIMRTIGDAYNAQSRAIVQEALQRQYGTQRLFDGRACVVGRDLDLNNHTQLEEFVYNAMAAAAYAVETNLPNFTDLNLADIDSSTQQLAATVSMNDHHITDAAGHPVRSDFRVDLVAVNRRQNSLANDPLGLSTEDTLATATAFVDLAYYPTRELQAGPYGQQQQVNYLYVPNLVVTSLHSRKLLTLGMVLLALANTYALRSNNAWTMVFNPRIQPEASRQLRDIGAVGIEANIEQQAGRFGTRIPTSAEQFTPQDFNNLMSSLVRPTLATSIDIPECSPSSWWTYVFGLAGAGNVEAKNAILEAANQLTNGHFARRYQERSGSGEVIRSMANRIHMGYYLDAAGNKRDIADYDHLAVLNMTGDTSPETAREWSDSFLDINGKSQDLRLAIRKRILDRLINPVYTGFAVRNMFEHNFIEALTQAVVDAGVSPQLRLPYNDAAVQQRASAAGLMDFALVSANAGINYGQQAGGPQIGGFSNQTAFSRF